MCQRVKRYAQKRIVELQDAQARASRAIDEIYLYAEKIATPEMALDSKGAIAAFNSTEMLIAELRAVLAIMDAPPARVIQVEEAVAHVDASPAPDPSAAF